MPNPEGVSLGSSVGYCEMTPEQERLYNLRDAQGGESPDKIKSDLGIGTTASRVIAEPMDKADDWPTVAGLSAGGRYGPNNHFAPSDRDVEPGRNPQFESTHKPPTNQAGLWHSVGYPAATAELARLQAERAARK